MYASYVVLPLQNHLKHPRSPVTIFSALALSPLVQPSPGQSGPGPECNILSNSPAHHNLSAGNRHQLGEPT